MATRTKATSKASRQVDEQLARYRSMRDFHLTKEPSGAPARKNVQDGAANLPFVIQKHAATRLHYDFRLGWNGVLKSWAVAKGPSDFPGDKRLAVQVEDHPLEYAGFEGTIPKGQYGGGAVMVWDFGNWVPKGDVDRGLREGHLKFELRGKKLKGAWALVRMHGPNKRQDKPNWLLIKEKDVFARGESDPGVTDKRPKSAITNRSIEQIAQSNDHVWKSARKDAGTTAINNDAPSHPITRPAKKRNPGHPHLTRLLSSTPSEKCPDFISTQFAQSVTDAPDGTDWIHELKLDGYRIQIRLQSNSQGSRGAPEATLLTRKGLDWTHRMPDTSEAASQLEVTSAILDGEAVVLDRNGVPNFGELQAAFQEGKNKYITYFAFDLLHLDGHNLRGLPLSKRKELLTELLSHQGQETPIRLSEHFSAKGTDVFAKACALGAEGIISKLSSAAYVSGRSDAWLKIKCILEQEFVIVGYTSSLKRGEGIGALLLGYYDAGRLIYAGRSGTGFTQESSRDLKKKLQNLAQRKSSLAAIPADAHRNVFWVKPQLVAQISFATWTRDNLVRQGAFKGLREDKPAEEVVREKTVPVNPTRKRNSAVEKQPAPAPPAAKKTKKDSGTSLPITHPEKVLDAESGMTKQMLAEYFVAVAERILPQIAGRPLSVVRCPDGSGKPCFFQKHIGLGLPKSVESVAIPNRKTGQQERFLTLDSVEGLVGLAQMGVLEIHPWGSRNTSLETPDRVIFDLDPDSAIDWPTIAASAEELRIRLKQVGLVSFLKHTGGKGLHIVVPIEPDHPWSTVKDFARAVVARMEKEKPDLYVIRMTKALRKNRIYLDYLRNDREATSIAPYSPRARQGAPVAIPLRWNELQSRKAPAFHVSDFHKWRARLNRDPWKEMNRVHQQLSASALSAAGVIAK